MMRGGECGAASSLRAPRTGFTRAFVGQYQHEERENAQGQVFLSDGKTATVWHKLLLGANTPWKRISAAWAEAPAPPAAA